MSGTGVSFDRYRRAAFALARALGIEIGETHLDRAWMTFSGGWQFEVRGGDVNFRGEGPDATAALADLVAQLRLGVFGALVYTRGRARALEGALDEDESLTAYVPHTPPLATCAHCLREYDARELAARPLAHPALGPGVRVCACARPLDPPPATTEGAGV